MANLSVDKENNRRRGAIIIEAQRVLRKEGDALVPSKTIKLKFAGPTTPPVIYYGGDRTGNPTFFPKLRYMRKMCQKWTYPKTLHKQPPVW